MKALSALAALAGLTALIGGVGGLSWWSAREAGPAREGDWRPVCASRLGWGEVDVVADEEPTPGRHLLFGVDRTASNAELSTTQLDAVLALARELPLDVGIGVLWVSDRSDRSSTPDLSLEPPLPRSRVRVTGLPCWPDCPRDSLFAQRCASRLDQAVTDRRTELADDLQRADELAQAARSARLAAWRADIDGWHPRPGSSILRFWHKIADLPPVRRAPEQVRVVLLSDLQEAGTKEGALVERLAKRAQSGVCPDAASLPVLAGVEVALVQTVTDRIDAEAWGRKWEAILACAGAKVDRHRYTPSLPLTAYLGPAV